MCGQAPEFQAGRAHTQVLAPGPQAKGWAEASPSPPWSLGLALATSLHGLTVPKCAKFSPTSRPLPKVTQRVTKPGFHPSSAQLQCHYIWIISKGSRAPAPPRARGPAPHRQVAAASQGAIASKKVITRLLLAQVHFQGHEIYPQWGERSGKFPAPQISKPGTCYQVAGCFASPPSHLQSHGEEPR